MTTQYYQISYTDNLGYFNNIHIRKLSFGNQQLANVMVIDGKVFFTSSLAVTLGRNPRFLDPDGSFGRAAIFNFEKKFDTLMDAINYPRRNAREQRVAERNRAICDLMMGLL